MVAISIKYGIIMVPEGSELEFLEDYIIMTIRELFSSYCLDYAKILIINDVDSRFTALFPAFNDPEDEDFKKFDSYADEIVKNWYYDMMYDRFVITIEKEEI